LKRRRSKVFLAMEDAYNNNNNHNHMLEAQDATDPWSLDSLDFSISSNQSSILEDEDDTWSQPFCISMTRESSSAFQRIRSFELEELNRAVATDSDSDSDDGICTYDNDNTQMSLRDFS
jgi:hypothetical protein